MKNDPLDAKMRHDRTHKYKKNNFDKSSLRGYFIPRNVYHAVFITQLYKFLTDYVYTARVDSEINAQNQCVAL